MTLMKRKKIVAYVKEDQNFFIFDFVNLEKSMDVGCKRSRYIVNKNKQI